MIIENKSKKGFVILLAVLLSSVFMIIGAFIFNISIKELILSSGGKSSQFAFYAADTGIECALYWDSRGEYFAESNKTDEPQEIYCNGQDVTDNEYWKWDHVYNNNNRGRTFFGFEMFPLDEKRNDCVIVVVKKENGNTVIESRGYNTCVTTSARRLERALRVTY